MIPKLKMRLFNLNGKDNCYPQSSEWFLSFFSSMGLFLVQIQRENGEKTFVKVHSPLTKRDINLTGFYDDCKLLLTNIPLIEVCDSEIKNNAPISSNRNNNVIIEFEDLTVEYYHLFSESLDHQIFGSIFSIDSSMEPISLLNHNCSNSKDNEIAQKSTKRSLTGELNGAHSAILTQSE